MVPHESRRSYTRTWGEKACWTALEGLTEEFGQLPTVEHYDALAITRDDLPSLATVRNRLGRWSEVVAILARGDRPSASMEEELREGDDERQVNSETAPPEAVAPRGAITTGGSRAQVDPARILLRQLRELPEDLRHELLVAAQDARIGEALQTVLVASVTGRPGLAAQLQVEATEEQLHDGLMRAGELLGRPMVRRIASALQVRGAERSARALLSGS
jgi:hypothetical protein